MKIIFFVISSHKTNAIIEIRTIHKSLKLNNANLKISDMDDTEKNSVKKIKVAMIKT